MKLLILAWFANVLTFVAGYCPVDIYMDNVFEIPYQVAPDAVFEVINTGFKDNLDGCCFGLTNINNAVRAHLLTSSQEIVYERAYYDRVIKTVQNIPPQPYSHIGLSRLHAKFQIGGFAGRPSADKSIQEYPVFLEMISPAKYEPLGTNTIFMTLDNMELLFVTYTCGDDIRVVLKQNGEVYDLIPANLLKKDK